MTNVKEPTQEEHDAMFEEYEREVTQYERMSIFGLNQEILKTLEQIKPLHKKLRFMRAAERRQESLTLRGKC